MSLIGYEDNVKYIQCKIKSDSNGTDVIFIPKEFAVVDKYIKYRRDGKCYTSDWKYGTVIEVFNNSEIERTNDDIEENRTYKHVTLINKKHNNILCRIQQGK